MQVMRVNMVSLILVIKRIRTQGKGNKKETSTNIKDETLIILMLTLLEHHQSPMKKNKR